MPGLVDWLIIAGYMLTALAVGVAVRRGSEAGGRSYFLADRSLPWWWAGTSIAATTFAADTPLAVAGIVADRGLSGNWMWLSWILVHAGVIVVFAPRWWRANVVTDAEFIARRYSDRAAPALRSFRAGLYGLVINVIILGWVLRAMSKIVQPWFRWEEWTPGLTDAVASLLPQQHALGGPGEAITIALLLTIVTCYSSLGGLRGVVRTDLLQFALGLIGSTWLAVVAWRAVGGRAGLQEGLSTLYGPAASEYTALFPSLTGGWASMLGMGAFAFGAYLIVQSFANIPADGGGYLQQRLSASRSAGDARKAALLFVVLQYLVRTWPWFVVAMVALVLVPLHGGPAHIDPELAGMVQADRELAYPALMMELLPPGAFGLLVVSLLAAFMSTVDTHFNWGASYVVTDVALRRWPTMTVPRQILVARLAVVAFAVLALVVAMHIGRIEQAWRWVAALGAAMGVPTLLRWIWWRMTAFSELAGAAGGLLAAIGLSTTAIGYEQRLVLIASASLGAMLLGLMFGPRPDAGRAVEFASLVEAPGFWPGRPWRVAATGLVIRFAAVAGVVLAVMAGLVVGHRILFAG